MDPDSISFFVKNAENRLFNVNQFTRCSKQHVKNMDALTDWTYAQKAKHMSKDLNDQRVKLLAEKYLVNQTADKSSTRQPLKENNHQSVLSARTTQSRIPKNAVDDQPLIPVHKDFQSLIDDKVREEDCLSDVPTESKKVVEKRTFLRKGEGLSRFRMKAEDFKLNKRSRTPKTRSVSIITKPKENTLAGRYIAKEGTALEAFELLEQQTNDSSFSSSSSVVARLMEDSVKSTPIKASEKKYVSHSEPPSNLDGEFDFFGVGKLSIIDEEPSKYEDSSRNSSEPGPRTMDKNCRLIYVEVSADENHTQDYVDEEQYNSFDCSSRCSCCFEEENTSHFTTSKSVSVITEKTTTVYSPAKSECTRKIEFYKAATEESECVDGESENRLETLLHNRLRELENEIDAFRHENSHLTELRENYEVEYKKFCDEKVQLLEKIRAEHLQSVREIEEEKKKLAREKAAFEKHMKEVSKRPNKLEKEEIRLLKEEIKLLKDEINKKESRWGAAQARIRTEMKQMKDLNASLTKEIKELKTKKVTFAPAVKKPRPPPKTGKSVSSSQPPEPSSKLIDSTSDLLQQLEFSDTKYIDKVRSLASNRDSSKLTNSRSVCVNSYLNNSQIEPDTCIDITSSSDEKESCDENGNIEKSFPDGRKEIWYANGNIKKISPDGRVTKTIYFNGDVKEVLENEIVKYYYAESKTWHSEYGNGLKIMEFPNGQVEKRFKDGSLEITYQNGTTYEVSAKGEERWTQIDGTVIVKNKTSDEKRIVFPNGQVEIHTPEYKRREYPDGTVKTVYVDGRQETKYWNGRIRLKTKDGTLLSDSEIT